MTETSNPTRILLVVDTLGDGGAERHVVDLAIALHVRGQAVTVACSVSGPLGAELSAAGVPVQVLMEKPVKRRVSLCYSRRLRALILAGQFDLVHAHIYASTAAAALATVGVDVPLLITEHTEATWQGSVASLLSRWQLRRAAHVIAVSESIRRLLRQRGVPAERVSVIENAVTPAPARTERLPVPVAWDVSPVVGVIARLQPEKGLEVFLRAANRLTGCCPDARYVVIGDGPLRTALVSQAHMLGLENHIRFLGLQPHVRALLPALAVLAVPSLTEGAPLVVLEAMAAGVPIVATTVGSIPDQIRHGREGLLVPPGDPVAMGNAIARLLANPEHARGFGIAAQERARRRFPYDAMLQKIEERYRLVMGGQNRSFLDIPGYNGRDDQREHERRV